MAVLAEGRLGDVLPPREDAPHGPHITRVAMRPGSPSHGYPMTFLRSSCCPALPIIQARFRVQVPDAP